MGKHPARRCGKFGHRAGFGGGTGECPLVVSGGTRRGLLPDSGTRCRAAVAGCHREVVREVCSADPESIRWRCRIDGRRGTGSDSAGNRTRAVGRPGSSAGPIRTCDRSADGQTTFRVVDSCLAEPVSAAGISGWHSLHSAGTKARRRRRRTAGRGRERTDRNRQGCVLPVADLQRQRGIANHGHPRFAHIGQAASGPWDRSWPRLSSTRASAALKSS